MTSDLSRRRAVLSRYVGYSCELKRGKEKRHKFLIGVPGKLVDVRRTRATVDFGSLGEWTVPVDWIWLPPSPQPAPNQMELFA